MAKFEITVHEHKCSGCLRCQLACSDKHLKVFNPSAARIRVRVAGVDCTIRFTDQCTSCGTCADNCFYGALEKSPAEERP